MRESVQFAYDSCQTRLINLHREYTSPQNSNHELYSSEEFRKQKIEIVNERDHLEKELSKVKEILDQSLEATERVFNFCAFAQYHFNNGDLQKKREIFSTIGSNLILMNKELKIDKLHPYLLIENELKSQRELYSRLEPKKYGSTKEKEAVLATSIPAWLRRQGSNLRPIAYVSSTITNGTDYIISISLIVVYCACRGEGLPVQHHNDDGKYS
jgi:hypothetical protein